ncbi:hypothetical protein Tco_1032825 [Tanacetum coccineum]|uniref:Uncharacterized protein n=1 Tax=Tanacetum coccineum TaxID=301880 RepID=A0ABQ5GD52_9ASTR
MSSSTVTYTLVYSDSEPWRFQWVSDDEQEAPEEAPQSPRQAPPYPDYVPGPEHPPSPDYVLGPEEPEQAPLSPDYVPEPDPITGLDDDDDDEEEEEEEHLALADSTTLHTVDHIPSPPLPLPSPPTYTTSTYAEAPLGYKAAGIRLRAASPPTHHPSEIPSPPLLLPSTTHRDDLPKADMPLRKRARFTAPTGRFEVGESSSAVAARQTRHTLAHRVDYGFIDTVEARVHASKSRAITAVGVVNKRVTDLVTTQRQETHELQVHCEDAQDDRALLRAQVSLLTRERRYFHSMASFYEREAVIARQAWAHSKSRSHAMEA